MSFYNSTLVNKLEALEAFLHLLLKLKLEKLITFVYDILHQASDKKNTVNLHLHGEDEIQYNLFPFMLQINDKVALAEKES